ncbi:MAG: hypothetical protein WD063_11420 [Pirellulales bacterium]
MTRYRAGRFLVPAVVLTLELAFVAEHCLSVEKQTQSGQGTHRTEVSVKSARLTQSRVVSRTTRTSSVTKTQAVSDFRYVYFGHYGTYHITSTIGTAHQYVGWYSTLVALKYERIDPNFIYYAVTEHGYEEERWAFAFVPYYPCNQFAVWRKADFNRDGKLEWRFVDLADRIVPRLPVD